jgi:2-dehydro-3-deoxyphosphooctonate aldolase (KDO 8-P synthase)
MTLWQRITAPGAFILIAGPCVIESEALCLEVARTLKPICEELGIVYIFKASYDKANRSSHISFRGIGERRGLEILGNMHSVCDCVLTDVHSCRQAEYAAEVCEVLQIPALLSRQTDLIRAASSTGRIINIKKGQFSAPQEMENAGYKAGCFGASGLMLTERGTTFGYNNLVADMRSIPIMQKFGVPVIFDATHSVQLPGANGSSSGGQREFAPILARAAVAAGVNGVFIETHPDPDRALSDGPNMIPLSEMKPLLEQLVRIRKAL